MVVDPGVVGVPTLITLVGQVVVVPVVTQALVEQVP
jgi:hypothetical protein